MAGIVLVRIQMLQVADVPFVMTAKRYRRMGIARLALAWLENKLAQVCLSSICTPFEPHLPA